MAALADRRNGEQPPQQGQPKGRSKVPPLDAFDHVQRRPPPDLPLRRGVPPPVVPGEGQGAGGQRAELGRQATRKQRAQPRAAAPQAPPKKKRPRKPVNPAKRRRRRRIAAVLALVVLIGVGAGVSVALLFKIDKFELQGEVPYSLEEIQDVFGYEVGEHMYSFSAGKEKGRIEATLPYIETMTIRRKLPNTVVFKAEAAEEAWCIPYEDSYVVVSDQLKVLRVADEAVDGLMLIKGLSWLDAKPGQQLALAKGAEDVLPASKPPVVPSEDSSVASLPESLPESLPDSLPESTSQDEGAAGGDEGAGGSDVSLPVSSAPVSSQAPKAPEPDAVSEEPVTSFEAMQQLLKALADLGFADVDWIDVADPLELRFSWQGRVRVELGARSGMEEKLATALVLLTDESQDLVQKTDKGTLDMHYTLTTGQTYFRPD